MVSGRLLNPLSQESGASVLEVLEETCERVGLCGVDEVTSVFAPVNEFTSLYGGRPYEERLCLTYEQVEELDKAGIGFMLTLSNHYFSEEGYEQARPILERLHRRESSVVITNDELARRLRRDFPLFVLKASVIKFLTTRESMERSLELYDFVTLHPKLNDDEEFLQSLPWKNRVILFGNSYCLYHCSEPICYPWFSRHLRDPLPPEGWPCSHKDDPKVMPRFMTRFDPGAERFRGYTFFKLVP